MPKRTPLAPWKSAFAAGRMLTEAQTVIALRLTGFAGLWTLAPGEAMRMTTEKQQAFAEAALAATAAALAGERPERIADAAIRPLGRRTRANARRLSQACARSLQRR